eukprot:CAMPEP_0114224838 /NCGR_PEP_ID=MMETSP0058-20121206/325_1 /TAXON_ID=36894 /ORGANISM="Pyramimonas parkeae, CCMP726" /LENGTH=44 /DNA_ID= /DNA_START= /DNA_END= /DNA_ORIENTATION=
MSGAASTDDNLWVETPHQSDRDGLPELIHLKAFLDELPYRANVW